MTKKKIELSDHHEEKSNAAEKELKPVAKTREEEIEEARRILGKIPEKYQTKLNFTELTKTDEDTQRSIHFCYRRLVYLDKLDDDCIKLSAAYYHLAQVLLISIEKYNHNENLTSALEAIKRAIHIREEVVGVFEKAQEKKDAYDDLNLFYKLAKKLLLLEIKENKEDKKERTVFKLLNLPSRETFTADLITQVHEKLSKPAEKKEKPEEKNVVNNSNAEVLFNQLRSKFLTLFNKAPKTLTEMTPVERKNLIEADYKYILNIYERGKQDENKLEAFFNSALDEADKAIKKYQNVADLNDQFGLFYKLKADIYQSKNQSSLSIQHYVEARKCFLAVKNEKLVSEINNILYAHFQSNKDFATEMLNQFYCNPLEIQKPNQNIDRTNLFRREPKQEETIKTNHKKEKSEICMSINC